MATPLLPPDTLELLVVSGNDAARFLQGQLTCDVEGLQDDQLAWGAACNNKGRVIAPFAIYRSADSFHLIFTRGLAVLFVAAMKRYLPFYKCQLEQHPCTALLAEPGDASLPEPLGVAHEDGQTAARLTTEPALLARFPAAGAHDSSAGDEALQQCLTALLRNGHFPFRPEDSELYTPAELHYDRHGYVSFSKGCYTGQEIVARMHYRAKPKRQLYLVTLAASAVPEAGSELVDAQGVVLGTLLHPLPASADTVLALVSLPIDFAGATEGLRAGPAPVIALEPFKAP